MPNIMEFALRMLEQNPNLENKAPWAKEAISAIRNNDVAKGEEIANNLCNTYGSSKEDGINRAGKFFRFW